MLKEHPKGLAFIFFAEMWERVGFYTLMAILVLYMDKVLGWTDSRKGDFYGLFLALCYFVPLLGGWLGDRCPRPPPDGQDRSRPDGRRLRRPGRFLGSPRRRRSSSASS